MSTAKYSATLPLTTGASIPALGFGTYSENPGAAYKAVLHALQSGWRHLDTAWGYGNEKEVGAAIAEFLKTNSEGVKREDIFVTTKVVDHMHKPEDVKWNVEDSLKKLGLEYVDLVLVHWPIALERGDDPENEKRDENDKPILNEALTRDPRPTWEAMESIYHAGLAKSIGVSNWTIKGLESLLKYAKIPPTCNQVEIHPLLPNTELISYCHSHSIIPCAYSPLGGQASNNPLFSNHSLLSVAEKHNHSLVQVLIAWGLKRGYSVITKSFTEERIESNLRVVELSEEEFNAVEEAVGGKRMRTCPYWASAEIQKWAEGEGVLDG